MSVQPAAMTTSGACVTFGQVKAVDSIDLELLAGEILGLIGPNGAGKTTLLNALSGFQRLGSGTLRLHGADVTRWTPRKLARAGIARTFQSVRPFERLSVLENIEVGTLAATDSRRAARGAALELLDRFNLSHRSDQLAGSLPHGEERRLGIARALAMRPKLLLLDEPAAGLDESESDALAATLAGLPAEFGLGLLIVEHDMRLIMGICDRIQVINFGRTIATGTPQQVRTDPAVLEAYLGDGMQVGHADD